MKKNLIIGIVLITIVVALAAWKITAGSTKVLSAKANNKAPVAKAAITKHPVATPTTLPSPTSQPTSVLVYHPIPTATPTPVTYQNYGWYIHNGQSMQYLNGSWYTNPQQYLLLTPTPAPTSIYFNCPQNITTEQCKRSCQGLTSDQCEIKCHGTPNDQC